MQQLKFFFLILLGSALLAYGAKVPGCEQALQDCCQGKTHCPGESGKKEKTKDCLKSCCIAATALIPVALPLETAETVSMIWEKIPARNDDRILQFITRIEHPPNGWI